MFQSVIPSPNSTEHHLLLLFFLKSLFLRSHRPPFHWLPQCQNGLIFHFTLVRLWPSMAWERGCTVSGNKMVWNGTSLTPCVWCWCLDGENYGYFMSDLMHSAQASWILLQSCPDCTRLNPMLYTSSGRTNTETLEELEMSKVMILATFSVT